MGAAGADVPQAARLTIWRDCCRNLTRRLAGTVQIAADLRYLDPQHTAVAGINCVGMTVRNATGIIGQFQGFLVDPVARRLRYVVIELLGRLRLMPVTTARVD